MVFDYKCTNCDNVIEVFQSISLPKEMTQIPEICNKCNEGKFEKQFTPSNKMPMLKDRYQNWKKGKSAWEISKYLTKNSETGRYTDPY